MSRDKMIQRILRYVLYWRMLLLLMMMNALVFILRSRQHIDCLFQVYAPCAGDALHPPDENYIPYGEE